MDVIETIDQARAGDSQAFDRLVAGSRDMALGYARSLVGDSDRAEDAVQEALIIAHRNLAGLAESAAFYAWLRGIVRNRCLRRPIQAAGTLAKDIPVEGSDEHIETHHITAAVARLPVGQQTVVRLHYEEGLSQAEIAERLGVGKAAVNMRLHAARAQLRRRLMMIEESNEKTRVGRVEGVDGPIVTFKFAADATPAIFGRLTSERDELCVVRALPDGMVQAIPAGGGGIWTPGREAVDTGTPFLKPLIDDLASQVVNAEATAGGAVLCTGIKTIDIFAPLAVNGRTGIFAEWGLGTLVLAPEMLLRLEDSRERQSLFVFMPPVRSEQEWRDINAEVAVGTRRLEVFYIPVEDPLRRSFVDGITGLDTKLVLSRMLAEQGIWPCIDPLRSMSRTAPARAELAGDVRDLLRRFFTLQYGIGVEVERRLNEDEWTAVRRGRQAVRFLSQPFFVAEPFTGRPGIDADAETTALTFAGIVAGEYDGRNRDAFYMAGATPT